MASLCPIEMDLKIILLLGQLLYSGLCRDILSLMVLKLSHWTISTTDVHRTLPNRIES